MVNKDTSPVVGIIIATFIAVLLGVVMLSITSDQVIDVTGLDYNVDSAQEITYIDYNNINETIEYTVTEAPTGWKALSAADGGCALTSFVMKNSTGTVLTDATDYTVDLAAGTYTMGNTTAVLALGDNATISSYTSCPDGYQKSFGGTILNLVPGFFALALLISVAFLIFWILRKEGIEL